MPALLQDVLVIHEVLYIHQPGHAVNLAVAGHAVPGRREHA